MFISSLLSTQKTILSGNNKSKDWISSSQKSDMKNSGDSTVVIFLDAFNRFTLYNELNYHTVSITHIKLKIFTPTFLHLPW